jgi:ferredoxin--NADP+ reductase
VLDGTGTEVPGLYATGWIKRGPVGLIGHTKSDAAETIAHLLNGLAGLPLAANPAPEAVPGLLDAKGVAYTNWEGWLALDAHEQALGAAADPVPTPQGPVPRERIKVVERAEMVAVSRTADEAARSRA